jgi:hypothetical protein
MRRLLLLLVVCLASCKSAPPPPPQPGVHVDVPGVHVHVQDNGGVNVYGPAVPTIAVPPGR